MLGIQGEDMVQSFDAVGHQQGDRAKGKQCQRIALPRLLLSRVNSAESVGPSFEWTEEARQRLPLPLEDTKHEDAERFRNKKNNYRKDENLKPADECHARPPPRSAQATRARRLGIP